MTATMHPRLSIEEVPHKLVPVILGGDILVYSFMRGLDDAYGLRSIVLASADIKFLSSSRFCEYRVLDRIDEDGFLADYLEELGRQLEGEGKVGLLLGSGDWYARILSENKERLAPWFAIPYIDFPLLDEITQKERFYDICEQKQIRYPKTISADCGDPDAQLDVDAFPYPVIAKPSNSARYHYAEFPGKKKIFEVETPEELSTIFENMKASSYDKELIVQDFIPGGDDAMYSITMFAVGGDVRLTCAGRVVLQDHDPTAIGNPVCIIDAWPQEAIEDARAFLEEVGYDGYANFDVKYDSRDGSYRFFEVNTRPGRNSYYVTLAGVNFVVPIVEHFVCGLIPEAQEAREPFLYACVPPYVVKRSVQDEELKRRVLRRYAEGEAGFPLFFRKDTLAHGFWSALTYWNQIPKFKRFLWSTGGKQAAVD